MPYGAILDGGNRLGLSIYQMMYISIFVLFPDSIWQADVELPGALINEVGTKQQWKAQKLRDDL